MVDALLKFQDRITRKAIRNFENTEEVSFKEFLDFVNFRMGTEFHEEYVELFYQHFLEKREEHKNRKSLGLI